MIAIVSSHHATQHFKHAFKSYGSVDHRERTFAEGVAQAARAVAKARLRRTNDDGRGWLLKTTQELQHAWTRGSGMRDTRLHRNRQIDDCDVHWRVMQEFSRLDSRSAAVAIDPQRSEKRRQLIGEVAVAPATRGHHQRESRPRRALALRLTRPR